MGGQPEMAQANTNSKPEGPQAYPAPIASSAGPQYQASQSAAQGQSNSAVANQTAPSVKHHENPNLDDSTVKWTGKEGQFSTR